MKKVMLILGLVAVATISYATRIRIDCGDGTGTNLIIYEEGLSMKEKLEMAEIVKASFCKAGSEPT